MAGQQAVYTNELIFRSLSPLSTPPRIVYGKNTVPRGSVYLQFYIYMKPYFNAGLIVRLEKTICYQLIWGFVFVHLC